MSRADRQPAGHLCRSALRRARHDRRPDLEPAGVHVPDRAPQRDDGRKAVLGVLHAARGDHGRSATPSRRCFRTRRSSPDRAPRRRRFSRSKRRACCTSLRMASSCRMRSVNGENPLLRAGLALAGANLPHETNESGILTALEASGLNLWGTQLVTLSACDTGVGESSKWRRRLRTSACVRPGRRRDDGDEPLAGQRLRCARDDGELTTPGCAPVSGAATRCARPSSRC